MRLKPLCDAACAVAPLRVPRLVLKDTASHKQTAEPFRVFLGTDLRLHTTFKRFILRFSIIAYQLSEIRLVEDPTNLLLVS